jgi:hypothetical protein
MADLTLETLRSLEDDGWQSLIDGRGGDFYGELMTAEAVMVLVDGSVLDRAVIRDSLSDSPTWDGVAITDERVVPVGDDAAALLYRARAHRGEEPPFEALMSSVYVRLEGRVRLALYQQTALRPDPAQKN